MLAGLVLLPFYTKAFDATQFGQLSLLISLTLLFYQAINFGLDTYLSVHFYDYKNSPEKQKQLTGALSFRFRRAAQGGGGAELRALIRRHGDIAFVLQFRRMTQALTDEQRRRRCAQSGECGPRRVPAHPLHCALGAARGPRRDGTAREP